MLDSKVEFKDLVSIMVNADMRAEGLEPMGKGGKILGSGFPAKW